MERPRQHDDKRGEPGVEQKGENAEVQNSQEGDGFGKQGRAEDSDLSAKNIGLRRVRQPGEKRIQPKNAETSSKKL